MTARQQRGGFALGLVVGVLVGLAAAVVVALFVTKVPVPFVDKVPRVAEPGASEAERLRRWDPNAQLEGAPQPRAAAPVTPPPEVPAPAGEAAGAPTRDPAAILAGADTPAPATAADPFRYYVQVGAYSRSEDAEQQRARLALLGFTARVSEREQAGRTVYRVRLGPFERKAEADTAQSRLQGSQIESALVRVER
jgi:cell division protein FtsN